MMYCNDEAGRAAYLAGFHAAEALDLHRRVHRGSYLALLPAFAGAGLRLRSIPKPDGRQRPLAVPNNIQAPSAFRRGVRWLWWRSLRRRASLPRQRRIALIQARSGDDGPFG